MHQRNSVKVDRGKAFSAGNDVRFPGSTQGSFHKIYRQKRFILEKVKDHSISQLGHLNSESTHSNKQWERSRVDWGHSSSNVGRSNSNWRSEHNDGQFDSHGSMEPKYNGNFSACKASRNTAWRETKFGSQFAPLSGTRIAKNDQEHSKRSYDRFNSNFSSNNEFDAPVPKRQKVEFYKLSPAQAHFSPGFIHNEQNIPLEETKWMYKNEKGRMSGPYGVKQLIEGLQAHFLQEDLPIYQVSEGRLCDPLPLKELADEWQRYVPDSRRVNSNQCSDPVKEASSRICNEPDLPPGFGGFNGACSERSSYIYSPNSQALVSSTKDTLHAASSLTSDLEDGDLSLPPGFEAAAMSNLQTTEQGRTSGRHSIGVPMPPWRGAHAMHMSHEQPHSMVHGQMHSSWQGDTSNANMNFAMQYVRPGTEVSPNGHTTWAYGSTCGKLPSFEVQSFQSSTVCIGLPVSKPATQSWPVPSSLQSCSSQSGTKEPVLQSTQCPDPLTLILSELLSAVKKTYVNSVVSAVIGEQLEVWLSDSKNCCRTSLPSDKGSPRSGARPSSLNDKDAMGIADSNRLQVQASTATTTCDMISSECRDMHNSEDVPISANNEKVGFTSSKVLPNGDTDEFSHDGDKGDSCVSIDETCRLSSMSSCSLGNESNQNFSVSKDESQQQSGEGIVYVDEFDGKFLSGNTSHTSLQEAEPLLNDESKKGNMKSSKQIMMMSSKTRARHSSDFLKVADKREISMKNQGAMGPMEAPDAVSSHDSVGCARTLVCSFFWKDKEHQESVEDSQYERNFSINGESSIVASVHSLAPSFEVQNIPDGRLSGALVAEGMEITGPLLLKANKIRLRIGRSKIHNWGIFCAEPVESGKFIIEYVGEVLRSRIAEIREAQYLRSGIGTGYLFRVGADTVIDATRRGGLARFINHSCDPNCTVKLFDMEGSKRLLIFAKRNIKAWEELTYNYNIESGLQNISCNCGAAECQGASSS
ncbi:hypothetical protein KP509_32G012900 [Ceratopteris richardii]|uniref:[histone H3]-lysine(4) N-trimethyltransferase n=2 Tax=Ceratopteris richardii TaxID=49495 RepID=A0A8T2QRR4_CERRI|nr:hypothetical protein KP509_32G012900 [Ceratopteris richardii]